MATKKYTFLFTLADGTTHSIPIEIPMGEDGGYYLPKITLVSESEIEITFIPSADGMPSVDSVRLKLKEPGGNVAYDEVQALTDKQKAQARENIGAQPKGAYALQSEIPSVPVQSVNGKTGDVKLTASDVGARSDNWMPSAQEVGALPNTYMPPNQTAEQVGADPKGTASAAVSQHNRAYDSHNDLRLGLKALSERLNAFFDTDDQTLDELSEIVAYITSNKTLIDSITTSKVSVTDIVDNLITNDRNKPLSAAQGVELKRLIDGIDNGNEEIPPSDWNASEGQTGHILNRPFYTDPGVVLFPETKVDVTSTKSFQKSIGLKIGEIYIVTIDGIAQEIVADSYELTLDGVTYQQPTLMPLNPVGEGYIYIKDDKIRGKTIIHSGGDHNGEVTISIALEERVVKIPEKYLPDNHGSGGNICVVNVREDDSTYPLVYRTNKTSQEINQARLDGIPIYCYYDSSFIPMSLAPYIIRHDIAYFFGFSYGMKFDFEELKNTCVGICIEGSAVTVSYFNFPTKVSDLTNDAGFVTEEAAEQFVQQLNETLGLYVTKEEAEQILEDYVKKDDLPDSGGNADLGVTGATVGQTVKIAAVDANGVPTAWESVEFPSGGGITDVQSPDGTTSYVDSEGIVKLPMANGSNVYGLVKAASSNYYCGVTIDANGKISLNFENMASNENWLITRVRNPSYNIPFMAKLFDLMVKHAMCDIGTATGFRPAAPLIWTDAERIAALLRMGCTVDEDGFVKWTAQEVAE